MTHSGANNEASWTFNAKGISQDAYRYDLVGADGPGAISLEKVGDGVKEIHISNLQPKDVSKVNSKAPDTTHINFVDGAYKGKSDNMTLVIEDVGADGGCAAEIASKNWGIENLTVQADKGEGRSYVDLSGLAGVKTLKFTGKGDITVTDVAPGIGTYDASEAEGSVNMAVVNPRSSTVVKGGAGNDTVTLNNGGAWTPAGLENIEALAINGNETVKLTKVDAGLTELWGLAKGGTVKDLTADNFKVHLPGNAANPVTVDGTKAGSLINIDFVTPDAAKAGTAQYCAGLSTNASGKVTLDVGENVSEFHGNSNGAGVSFSASNATALEIKAASDVFLNSYGNNKALKSVQDVTLNLENGAAANDAPYSTTLWVDMPNAQTVTVNAGGQGVALKNLGDEKKADSSINLDVNDAAWFSVGNVQTTVGCNIDINIESESSVMFGSVIKNSTNLLAGGEGDISIAVSGGDRGAQLVGSANNGAPASTTVTGGPMTINFADWAGKVYGGIDTNGDGTADVQTSLILKSSGTISYTGAEGADNVVVNGMHAGSGSSITLGDGADTLKFDTEAAGKDGVTSVTVNLDEAGAAADTIAITAQVNGKLLIDLEGFDAKTATVKDTISGASKTKFDVATKHGDGTLDDPKDAGDLAKVLEDFGIVSDATDDVILGIKAGKADGTFSYDGELYAINAGTISEATTLVCIGSVDDVNVAGILN